MSEKPLVDPYLGDTPSDLIIEDIIIGDGNEAVAGLSLIHI